MSDQKGLKRIAIYPLLASGHTNVCVTIAKILLNNYPVEIIFITDAPWEERLSKFDSRFKFRTYEYESEDDSKFVENFMEKLEAITRLPLVNRMGSLWTDFNEDDKASEFDRKCGDIMVDLKPDLVLMDQMNLRPSVIKANVPYAYIMSANPLTANISEEYPAIGSDAYVSDKEKILEFRKGLVPYVEILKQNLRKEFKEAGVELVEDKNLIRPVCENFSVYCYPKEIDYYTDEVKAANNLISFDTPIIPERLPAEKFELPEHFKGHKIVYVSLGSMFSQYTQLIQRIVDNLASLPYKFIVSKGPRGDALKLPNDNFIGENYINQLAVLQVCDVMIAHGGNNTLGECFYFGVPCIILPVFVDQINNGTRIQETGYGYSLPIYDYTDDELKDCLVKLVNDESIKSKWKKASERIQKDNNYNEAIEYIFNSIKK